MTPTVLLTDHAVERYHERVRPTLDYDQAEAEARAVLAYATFTAERPGWIFDTGEYSEPFVLFALIGDSIAFCCRAADSRYLAVTCITRAGLAESARFTRNARRRGRQRTRHALRQKWRDKAQAKHGGKPRKRRGDEPWKGREAA